MRKVFLSAILCLAFLGSAIAQHIVSGTVISQSDGLSLPGVSVSEKGTTNGTITDSNGKYSIKVPNKATLVFSFVGMKTVEEIVNNRSTINIKLVSEDVGLDEVVVTALGIKKEAKALGYAVSKVATDRILASGTPVNALQSLYGSAAGVQVSSTASGPSGGMKINIRNAVSFDKNSSTRPLIVVDGVPIHDENTGVGYASTDRDNGTGINDINPDDIASFEILKGAKASVLYGSEGANGVILITTKSGAKAKGLGVSASFATSWDNAAFLPKLQNEYGTGRSPSNPSNDDQGYYLDKNGKRALDWNGKAAFGPKFDPNVKLIWWDGVERAWVPQTKNIYNDLFKQGRQNTANVAVSGSNDKGSIRLSYTNLDLTPIRPSGEYTKNTFSLSTSYKLNDNISIKYSGNFYFSKNLNAANASSMDAEGNLSELGAYSNDINVGLLKSMLVTSDGYNYFSNPSRKNLISNGRQSIVGFLWDQLQNEAIFTRLHNIQSLTVDLKINKIFSATLMGGMDFTNDRNIFKGKLEDPALIGPNSGQYFSDKTRIFKNTYGQGMLNFNTKVNDFGVSGFVGGAIRKNYAESKGANTTALVIPNFFSFRNLPTGVQPVYTFENGEDILYSILGSAQVSWKDQVYLEAQARQDWSSILPPSNNSYFYPGLSATWIVSQSLKLPEVIDFTKVRVSWADVGRPGPRYFSNVNYDISKSGGGYILSPPSDLPPMDSNGVPNLKPERKREYEIGLESYLFKNQRIGIDFSYYKSNTYNQIMAVTAPPGMGVSNIRMNAGSVSNRGWEMSLKIKPIYTKDFKWDVNLTFARSKTRVEKLDGKLNSLTLWNTNGLNAVAEVGGEYGIIYQQKGWYNYINPSDPNDPNNGKRVVNDSGTSYDYSSNSAKMVGKMLPDLTGGIFTSFEYKNLRLIANLDYSFGATFISETETYMMAAGVLKESLKYRDAEHGGIAYYLNAKGEKIAGTNTNGATYYDGVILDGVTKTGVKNTKVVSAEDYYYNSYFSNGFFPEDRIYKSDYIALRNIALDYTVPYSLSKRVGLNNLVFSVFGNNLAYIYKAAPNSVPESTNGTGWGDSSYGTTALPTQRSLGVAVKIKF